MPTADLSGTLSRILEYAAQNLRFEKLLIQLGLDPANITYEAIFHRLLDIFIANINFANTLALVGAIFYVATLMVRTIIPLRIVGIISIVFFIGYGALAGAVATLLLYLLSLPINVIRLSQMLSLAKKARISAEGDLSMDWLRPFMTPRKYKKGDVLFHKGDLAKEMFLTITGKFLVTEIGVELPPGRIMWVNFHSNFLHFRRVTPFRRVEPSELCTSHCKASATAENAEILRSDTIS